jgi:hypothetical protein
MVCCVTALLSSSQSLAKGGLPLRVNQVHVQAVLAGLLNSF